MTTLPHGGELLRRWLFEHRAKAAHLGRKAGLTPPQMSRILSGDRSIQAREAIALSGATGIPAENLVDPEKILVLRTPTYGAASADA